jgi:hypothetical protein
VHQVERLGDISYSMRCHEVANMILPPSYHVIQSLSLLQVEFRLLEEKRAQAIRSRVIDSFASHRAGPLWENLLSAVAVQDADGWRIIDNYLLGASFLIFFDEAEDKSMIEVSAGASLTGILGECPGFEFYITDPETTYLLCFNHHDFLIGAGRAAQWQVANRARK